MENVMAGTLTPEQMRTQALIQALRAEPAAPTVQQQGRVQAATNGMTGAADALGQGIGVLGQGIANNLRTANLYNTTPFSQQTNMLAAQDAAFL